MQSNPKEIYQITAERTGIPEQTYKDIGNAVFASLNAHFRKPPSLILKLRGIGSWHLRRKRMQIITENFPPNLEKSTEDLSEHSITKWENKIELHNLFLARLADYDRYIDIRDSVREIRYKTQSLIEPPEDEEC